MLKIRLTDFLISFLEVRSIFCFLPLPLGIPLPSSCICDRPLFACCPCSYSFLWLEHSFRRLSTQLLSSKRRIQQQQAAAAAALRAFPHHPIQQPRAQARCRHLSGSRRRSPSQHPAEDVTSLPAISIRPSRTTYRRSRLDLPTSSSSTPVLL